MNTLTRAIRENWADLSDRAQAWAIRTRRIPINQWKLIEEGHHYDTITATTADEALEQARSNVDSSNYDYSEAIWIDVRVYNVYSGDDAQDSVQCDVAEPNCEDGQEHHWRSPYSVLGASRKILVSGATAVVSSSRRSARIVVGIESPTHGRSAAIPVNRG